MSQSKITKVSKEEKDRLQALKDRIENLSVDQLRALLRQYCETNVIPFSDRIVKLSEIFAYAGFDPLFIFKLLHLIEPRPDIFIEDMIGFLTYYAIRGVRWGRMKTATKTSDPGASYIIGLARKYGLTDGFPRGRSDITLGRIAGVFPQLVFKIFRIKDFARATGRDKDDTIPISFCFPAAAALIPLSADKDAPWNKFYDSVYIPWAIKFDKTINGEYSDETRVKQYAAVTRSSTAVPLNERETFLKEQGWTGTFNPVIITESYLDGDAHSMSKEDEAELLEALPRALVVNKKEAEARAGLVTAAVAGLHAPLIGKKKEKDIEIVFGLTKAKKKVIEKIDAEATEESSEEEEEEEKDEEEKPEAKTKGKEKVIEGKKDLAAKAAATLSKSQKKKARRKDTKE